jgi:hypothetical protein
MVARAVETLDRFHRGVDLRHGCVLERVSEDARIAVLGKAQHHQGSHRLIRLLIFKEH